MTELRFRRELLSLPAYKAGQRLQQREDVRVYKLSSNENPLEPIPHVLDAIAAAAREVNRYPDPLNTELVRALARLLEVDEAQLAVSTGSVALLGNLMQVLAGPGDEIVYAWRSFEAYPIWAQITGATSVQVPLRNDFDHDLDAMAAAVNERTRAVIICTPNNPTGTAVAAAELHAFLAKIPKDVVVIIDEAYTEFVTDTFAVAGMDFFRSYPNVVVLRTFSKAYGLAGLRVGYAIAPAEIADLLRRTAIPFGVSGIAQAAALAALEHADEALAQVRLIIAERERVTAELAGQGWQLPEMSANFYWLPTGADSPAIQAACAEAGVAVRPFPEGLRITIGEPAANDRVLGVLAAYRATR